VTLYRCCDHCVQDPMWHRTHEPHTHRAPCGNGVAPSRCDSGGDVIPFPDDIPDFDQE